MTKNHSTVWAARKLHVYKPRTMTDKLSSDTEMRVEDQDQNIKSNIFGPETTCRCVNTLNWTLLS